MSSPGDNPSTTNPTGGRKGVPEVGEAGKAVQGVTGGAPVSLPKKSGDPDANAGFGLEHFDKDVKGSLKVHIKLDLDVDIRITARIRGDIAIGLL
ncbi:hypothetical protein ACEQ8H_003287 [Pleosporales sp. CAS-2024a]